MLQKPKMCPSFLKIVPILLLVLFLSATIAEVPEVFLRPQNPFKEHEEPEWVKEIKKQLEKRLSFDFVDTPFTNVVTFLQNLTGCNMVIDPAGIEGMGPKITLKVTDMKLEPALKWILRLADLDFELKDEVIFISKWDKQALHLYEVSELIQLVKQDGAEGKDGLTPLRLISFIKGAIKPATWKKEGVGISYNAGVLAISQTEDLHRSVGEMLKKLLDQNARTVSMNLAVASLGPDDWGHFQEFLRETGSLKGKELTLPLVIAPEHETEAFRLIQPLKTSLSASNGQKMRTILTDEVRVEAAVHSSRDRRWCTLKFAIKGKTGNRVAAEISTTVRLPHGITCIIARRGTPEKKIELFFVKCSVDTLTEQMERLKARYLD